MPQHTQSPERSGAPQQTHTELQLRRALVGRRLLLVCADGQRCELIAALLAPWNVRIVAAASGPAGLVALHDAVAARDPVAAVLVDADLPGMDASTFGVLVAQDEQLYESVLVEVTVTAPSRAGAGAGSAYAAGVVVPRAVLTPPVVALVAHNLAAAVATATKTERLVFDFERAVGRFVDDVDLVANVARMFAEDARGRLDTAVAALKAGDRALLRETVHTLKGAAANLSATGIRQRATAIEAAAEGAPADQLRDLLDALHDDFACFCALMERLPAAIARRTAKDGAL